MKNTLYYLDLARSVSVNKKEHSVLIYTGRFQPVHIGHLKMVFEALLRADRLIIVFGPCNSTNRLKNPYSPDDCEKMFQTSLGKLKERVIFVRINEHPTDDAWMDEFVMKSQQALQSMVISDSARIGIIGNPRDAGTAEYMNFMEHYLRKRGSGWSICRVASHEPVSATKIRESLFADIPDNSILRKIPVAARRILKI